MCANYSLLFLSRILYLYITFANCDIVLLRVSINGKLNIYIYVECCIMKILKFNIIVLCYLNVIFIIFAHYSCKVFKKRGNYCVHISLFLQNFLRHFFQDWCKISRIHLYITYFQRHELIEKNVPSKLYVYVHIYTFCFLYILFEKKNVIISINT